MAKLDPLGITNVENTQSAPDLFYKFYNFSKLFHLRNIILLLQLNLIMH